MKLFKFALFCLATTGASLLCSAAELSKVGDFALLDQQGKFHQLSWYGDQKAIVIFIQGNGCPIVRNGVPTLKEIRDEFESQGVTFFMLNPQMQDNRESIAKEAEEFGYDFPILVDEAQLVAESLGVDRTSESFVIDPKTMTVVFRGPIDDRLGYESQRRVAKNHYLKDALTAVLSGQAVADDIPSAPGCLINFPSRDQHRQNKVSYAKDIVPILKDNCVSCHHDGGIGPWSMSSHAMVQGWSKMMREVVMTRRMPPGQIDPHVGKPIEDMVEITAAEKQLLVHWIDAGATIDDGAEDPLAALTFDDPKYSLGEPDMIFKVPAQSIPATGVIDYRYVPVELNLDKDIWVRAVEFIPGDRQVLHHVIAYLASPADKTVRGRQNGSARGASIGGFAPGRQPDVFRDNSGRLVRKGSNLLLQMHYTTSGKATVDETEIGLFIYDKPPAYIMAGGVAGQRRFLIPANAKEHKLEGEQLIERDAYLYSMMPHMHFRGKNMNYTAVYPDGRSEMLLSVPKYEFNWQFSYQLKDPLFLPAGTRLVANGAMDNSDRNRFNPDPSKPVHFGLQTKHEMFFGFTTLRYVGDTPESLLADKPPSRDGVAGL
ncbi:MAG: redoxin domain-containing protein [Gammaproteobacteria bacterium]|nr:redoxin domain-containing protein [Gammaproteobacteria bacterium]